MTVAWQESWFQQAVGKAMNLDAVAGLQCVDVPNDYAEHIFGDWEKTIGRGDAWNKFYIAPVAYWDKIAYSPGLTPQRGDVIVWPGSSVVSAGHTAVVTGSSATTVSVIEQSGGTNKAAYAKTHPYRVNGVMPTGWLRPKLSKIKGGTDMDLANALNALNQAAHGKPMTDAILKEKMAYIQSGGSWNQLIKDIFEFSPWFRSLPRILDDVYAGAGVPLDAKRKEELGYALGDGRLGLPSLLKDVFATSSSTLDKETVEKAQKFDQFKTLFRGLMD